MNDEFRTSSSDWNEAFSPGSTWAGQAGLGVKPVGQPWRLIRASAGTGKTYQLTLRYVSLLAAGVRPGTILATTFTRKAAGEILGRVLAWPANAAADTGQRDALGEELETRLSEADCIALLRGLAGSLHVLSISTIDAFFARIVKQFALELDVPAEARFVDEAHPLARQMRLEAIEAVLAEDDLATLLRQLQRLHHDSAVRSVTGVLDDLFQSLYEVYRETPEVAAWEALEVPDGDLDERELDLAVQHLAEAGEALPRKQNGQPDGRWLKAWQTNVADAQARQWELFLVRGLAAKLAQGAKAFYSKPIPGALAEAYAPLLAHARARLVGALAEEAAAMHDLLGRFHSHYQRLRRRRGLMLFSDLTHKLSRELFDGEADLLAEIYFRLDTRVQHLLLDEFQDTSVGQWRVLRPFVEEILPEAGSGYWDRSFFCVGDTKQAIYGWRGGCVELFDEVEGLHPDAGAEALDVSRRSSQVVLDAVNTVFKTVHHAPPFVKADSEEAEADRAGVEAWLGGFNAHSAAQARPGHVRLESSPAPAEGAEAEPGDEDEEPAGPGSHERYAAERVAALHREAPERSIGVLVVRNRTARRLLFELRRLNLPVSGEGGNPLVDDPAVGAALAAITLADHPGDSAAAFHLANSPLGEVLGMADASPREAQRVGALIRRELVEWGYAAVLGRWVRAVAGSCARRGLQRLMQLVELAEQYEPMAELRPGEFVRFVEATAVEEPSPASIRVMTVHAAKGLEFDAVVLPELNRLLSDRGDVLVQRDGPTGPVRGVFPPGDKQIRPLAPQIQHAHAAQRTRQRQEDLSQLYVAMTRARHALYMIVRPIGLTDKGQVKADGTSNLSFATLLRHALGPGVEEESPEGGQVLHEAGVAAWWEAADADADTEQVDREQSGVPHSSLRDAVWHPSPTDDKSRPVRVELPAGAQRRAWLTISPSGMESGDRVRAAELLRGEPGEGLTRGTLIHAWFERVGYLDEAEALPDREALLDLGRRLMPGADEAWLAEQLGSFEQMLQREGVREALRRDGAADAPWRERAFAARHEGRLLRGVFDRVAIWRERGQPVGARLIDFKTDRVSGEALHERAGQYRTQLRTYRQVLAGLLGVEPSRVEAWLLFVEAGQAVALSELE